jgi:hypothetical protein
MNLGFAAFGAPDHMKIHAEIFSSHATSNWAWAELANKIIGRSAAPLALFSSHNLNPGLTAGHITCRPFGPGSRPKSTYIYVAHPIE